MTNETTNLAQGLEAETRITLQSLSELTGFPVEMINQELFLGSEKIAQDGISIEQLRSAMLHFIDDTLAKKE